MEHFDLLDERGTPAVWGTANVSLATTSHCMLMVINVLE